MKTISDIWPLVLATQACIRFWKFALALRTVSVEIASISQKKYQSAKFSTHFKPEQTRWEKAHVSRMFHTAALTWLILSEVVADNDGAPDLGLVTGPMFLKFAIYLKINVWSNTIVLFLKCMRWYSEDIQMKIYQTGWKHGWEGFC